MKKRILLYHIFFFIFISIYAQDNKGKICDVDGTCVFELKPKNEYHTKSGTEIENQFKEATVKKTACDVMVWTDGDKNHKVYKNLISYKSPVEIVKKTDGKRLIRFQYVGTSDDAAVEAFNDVVFVDHGFTMYLVMPEHNCHGLPTSPTVFKSCALCGKQYKIQEFYNEFTKKNISIYIGANQCNSKNSKTGNCDNLSLNDVPECPKLDQPDCDQVIKRGDINK